jgi:hypothetical protein
MGKPRPKLLYHVNLPAGAVNPKQGPPAQAPQLEGRHRGIRNRTPVTIDKGCRSANSATDP